MNRKILWGVLVIGLALVIAPLAISLPSKAAAGERMMGDFQPIMQPEQVKTTAYYYNDVFTPLGKVVPAMSKQNIDKFQGYIDGMTSVKLTQTQMQKLQQEFPQLAPLFTGMPAMIGDLTQFIALMRANAGIFAQVPAGLDHYGPLVSTMQGNVNDYQQVSSLPNFNLFTWFFMVPGVLLVLLAGAGLYGERLEKWTLTHMRPTHA